MSEDSTPDRESFVAKLSEWAGRDMSWKKIAEEVREIGEAFARTDYKRPRP
jgi:hypothetical protein